MIALDQIEDPGPNLRLATLGKAEIIHALRLAPDFSTRLSRVTAAGEDQYQRSHTTKHRDSEFGEYH